MITIKPLNKGEPSPYLAYKRIVQNRYDQNKWTIEWHDRTGLIKSRTIENALLPHVIACAKAESKKFKNPEYFKLTNRAKMAYTRTKTKLDNLTKGVRTWLGWLPRH